MARGEEIKHQVELFQPSCDLGVTSGLAQIDVRQFQTVFGESASLVEADGVQLSHIVHFVGLLPVDVLQIQSDER